MIGKFQQRWVIAGTIWAAILGLSYTNIQTMQNLIFKTQQDEIVLMNTHFWDTHSKHIQSILKQNESLFHPIETMPLGLLEIETDLKKMAAKYQFQAFELKLPEAPSATPVAVEMGFQTMLPPLLNWLDEVKTRYPYYLFKALHLKNMRPDSMIQVDVQFDARLKLSEAE